MPAIGAELEQLVTLKQAYDRHSASVSELLGSLDSQLGATHWVGPAAERFRGQWTGDFRPALARLRDALAEAGLEVERRRAALEAAGA